MPGSWEQQQSGGPRGFGVEGDQRQDTGDQREFRRRLPGGRSHRLAGRRFRRELKGKIPSLPIRLSGQTLVDTPGLIELPQNVGCLFE